MLAYASLCMSLSTIAVQIGHFWSVSCVEMPYGYSRCMRISPLAGNYLRTRGCVGLASGLIGPPRDRGPCILLLRTPHVEIHAFFLVVVLVLLHTPLCRCPSISGDFADVKGGSSSMHALCPEAFVRARGAPLVPGKAFQRREPQPYPLSDQPVRAIISPPLANCM